VREQESNSNIGHRQKALVAAGEAVLFALGGLVWPPLSLGMVVTVPVTLLEGNLATNDFSKNLRKLERKIDELGHELGQRVDEHIRFDHEPIPPNPETATIEEAEIYKKAVRDAGNRLPRK